MWTSRETSPRVSPLSSRTRVLSRAIPAAAVLLLVATSGAAQERERDPERMFMTRPELTDLLDWYERSAKSPAYSDALRARAVREASNVQTRLEEGDFQVGDRVPVIVDGEPELSDTFTVEQGRVLRFGENGTVDLNGVLRYELDERLMEFMTQFVRLPSLSSQPLTRITIEGAVGLPGFYNVPSETPIADVIMIAGGPLSSARIQDLRIERGGDVIWSGDDVRRALAEGRTLDQMSLRAGDRIVLPQSFALGNAYNAVRTFTLILAVPASIIALIAIFGGGN
jgi:protein involved in polysaccharide export with SLBB domain